MFRDLTDMCLITNITITHWLLKSNITHNRIISIQFLVLNIVKRDELQIWKYDVSERSLLYCPISEIIYNILFVIIT